MIALARPAPTLGNRVAHVSAGVSRVLVLGIGYLLAIGGLVAPAVIALQYIRQYGVNVAVYDQWAFIPLFGRLFTGTLTYHDLLAVYNDHRLLVPRLMMLPLGVVTHYNNLVEMYLGWLFVVATLIVLGIAHRRALGPGPITFLVVAPAAWWLFDLRQYENFMNGWQSIIFLVDFLIVLTLVLLFLSTGLDWKLALAGIGAVAASYTFANGLLLWPVGALQIALHKLPSRRARLTVWLSLGALTLATYLYHFAAPASDPTWLFLIRHPLAGIGFVLEAIGSPVGSEARVATAAGIVLVIVYGWCLGHGLLRRDPPARLAVGLISFAVLSALMLAVGRSGLGGQQALGSRYTSLSISGILGTNYYFLVQARALANRFSWRGAGPVILSLLPLLTIAGPVRSMPSAQEEGAAARAYRSLIAYFIATYAIQPDSVFRGLYPDPAAVRQGAAVLDRYHLNVFSAPRRSTVVGLARLDRDTPLFLEEIDGVAPRNGEVTLVVKGAEPDGIVVHGWAIDGDAKSAAGGLFVDVDGRREVPAYYGLDRPDVARYFGCERCRYAGFIASFASDLVGPGRHVLRFEVVTADEHAYFATNQSINLEIG